MGSRTVAQLMALGKWGLLSLLFAPGYPVRALDGAHFTESIRTEAITRLASTSRRRLLARDAHFTSTLRGDTVVVSADSVTLSELADGHSRTLDTDGFVGGRYHLVLDSLGRANILERPFVPDDIVEVSDLGRAMDDFFPPLPPGIAVGATDTDPDGREWRRLADSSTLRRYRYHLVTQRNAHEPTPDSVDVTVTGKSDETSSLAWSTLRGPMNWTRRIESDVTTRLRGQTVMGSVVQRIEVSRAK
ncbi:MAG: hypothetical protein ABIZ70_00600 [Gemmatimonadales bacterium]